MGVRLVLALALLLTTGGYAATGQSSQPGGQVISPTDSVSLLVDRLRDLALKGDSASLAALSATPAGASLAEFVRALTPAPTNLVVKERDRSALPGGGQRVLMEIFAARDIEARVFTWQMDLAPTGAPADPWRIVRLDRLSIVTGLFRLSLDTAQQFDVHALMLTAPDLTLQMSSGSAFVATTPDGPTAVVLLGRGQIIFSPPDPSERTQVRIFSGSDRLTGDFDAAFIRIRPSDFTRMFGTGVLTPKAPVLSDTRRATSYFDEYIGRSLNLDLNDLSRERWSLLPQEGDLIAEIRTKKFGNLTYARAQSDAEDVSFFDRRRRKNIAVYASAEKLATRGQFYSDDDSAEFTVRTYDLEADFTPDRPWIDGRATLGLTTVAPVSSSITLRIADALAVRSVYSPQLGRLMHLRVVGQNAVIVNFPIPVPKDTALTLSIVYGGRIDAQELDREAIRLDQEQETVLLQPEPRYIYSNRNYWYPQSPVGGYFTVRMRLSVPLEYDIVASGMPSPPVAAPSKAGERPRKMYTFTSDRPVRYLACVISRFSVVTTAELLLPSGDDRRALDSVAHGPAAPDPTEAALSLVVQANPRQTARGRGTAERAGAIFQYYASIMGEAPYPSFTVALSESDLPGGHSPAYFAILNQTLPTTPYVWRNDPVAFVSYPTFFLAHELAHQWWGQAVGWKNYHEQWLSEGFAQYFAAMFSQKERGNETFEAVLRQMRRWAIDSSSQGPVYLGYRLGHIKGDSRVFRAVIYNKAAMVLHMLRSWVGEDAFFRGLRGFYTEWRFKKAGTDDFRVAMEKASGQDLQPFFDAWIARTEIPRLSVHHTVQGSTATITIEQRGEILPVPVTITLEYAAGNTETLVIPVAGKMVTKQLALTGPLRDIVINQEQTLAIFDK